jgi:hypothetical protein
MNHARARPCEISIKGKRNWESWHDLVRYKAQWIWNSRKTMAVDLKLDDRRESGGGGAYRMCRKRWKRNEDVWKLRESGKLENSNENRMRNLFHERDRLRK